MKSKAISLVGMAAIALLAACGGEDGKDGAAGPPGAAGKDGNGSDPSKATASAVSPALGFLGRELDVHLGFDGSKFDPAAKPTVDFGQGVKVTDVKVVSSTLLSVHIKIDPTAPLGAKDVKVGDLVAQGAFEVKPSLTLQLPGPAEQGGVGVALVNNVDSAVFDTGQGGFAGSTENLVSINANAVGPYAAQAIFLVPPNASGKVQYAAANLDASGKPFLMFYSAADAISITPRAPASLAFGTPKNGESLTGAYGSKLYKFASPANQTTIVSFMMHVADTSTTALSAALFSAGGTAKDLVAKLDAVDDGIFGPQPKQPPYDHAVVMPLESGAAKDWFLSVADISGAKANKFDLAPTTTTATIVNEGADAHDTAATAQDVTVPAAGAGVIVKGNVKDSKKVYYYKLTVAANERLEVGLDAPAQGLAGIGKPNGANASFVAVAPQGKLTAVVNDGGALPAGPAYVAVAGEVGAYKLSIRRLP
jgi:hypothetical protein